MQIRRVLRLCLTQAQSVSTKQTTVANDSDDVGAEKNPDTGGRYANQQGWTSEWGVLTKNKEKLRYIVPVWFGVLTSSNLNFLIDLKGK